MDFLKLKYFIAVAEHLNFTAAAASLFMTQPSLSRQIADLERELGVQLFYRGKRGVSLTNAGKELYCDAVEVVSKTSDMLLRANMLNKGAYGRLFIGYQGMYIYSGLIDSIQKMHQLYPDVEMILDKYHPTNLITLLRNNTIDIAWTIRMGIENTPGVDTITVAQDELMLVVPDTHRLADAAEVALADVADDSFVLSPRDYFSAMNDRIIHLCNKSGFSPKFVTQPRHSKSVLMLVAAGIGITIQPYSYQRMHIPGIRFIPIASKSTKFDVVAAWRKDNPKPAVPLFYSIIKPI